MLLTWPLFLTVQFHETGGMSGETRRWTLRDVVPGELRANFLELTVHVEITDGCSCQVHLVELLFPDANPPTPPHPTHPPPIHIIGLKWKLAEILAFF